jgi:hypothetical protein
MLIGFTLLSFWHVMTCYNVLFIHYDMLPDATSYHNISLHPMCNINSQNGCNPRIAREQNLSLWPWKNYLLWKGMNLAYFGLRRYIHTCIDWWLVSLQHVWCCFAEKIWTLPGEDDVQRSSDATSHICSPGADNISSGEWLVVVNSGW